MLQYESHDQVDDQGGPDGNKGQVNEEQADGMRFNAKLFAPPFADTECLPFKYVENPLDHAGAR